MSWWMRFFDKPDDDPRDTVDEPRVLNLYQTSLDKPPKIMLYRNALDVPVEVNTEGQTQTVQPGETFSIGVNQSANLWGRPEEVEELRDRAFKTSIEYIDDLMVFAGFERIS